MVFNACDASLAGVSLVQTFRTESSMRLDKISTYIFRLSLLGGVGILFLLCGIIFTAQAVSPVPVAKTPLLPSLVCPDAPPVNVQSRATLTFCSPINQGFVGGPYGT